MNTYTVEVAVSLARPPRHDATIFYVLEAPNGLTAELTACQWASHHRRVVMPVGSVVTNWPES
jgi:hypothetical protein